MISAISSPRARLASVDEAEEHLDLQGAADALGVHYQTAYRWVRSGRLPARLVAGQYRVGRADLERVDDQRRKPIAPRPPSGRRLHHQVERMYEALLNGDEAEARRICQRLVGDGTQVVAVVETVLAPALRRIGSGWHDGEVPIWAEHRASKIAESVLAQLSVNPRGRRRGVVAVAAVSGDHHSLPTTMATVALREPTWLRPSSPKRRSGNRAQPAFPARSEDPVARSTSCWPRYGSRNRHASEPPGQNESGRQIRAGRAVAVRDPPHAGPRTGQDRQAYPNSPSLMPVAMVFSSRMVP